MFSALVSKYIIKTIAPSMRSPSGLTGWIARQLMRTANPISTKFAIDRMDLEKTDVFVELGAGEGAGIKAIMDGNKDSIPSRIVLVEISDDFRTELMRVVQDDISANPSDNTDIEIHSDDCKNMPFLKDDSVDKIFGMNVVYFLDPLAVYLKELHRVLKPGGSIVWGCKFKAVPKDSDVFINVEEEAISNLMKEAGFKVSSEFVKVSSEERMQNYLELKGVKVGISKL